LTSDEGVLVLVDKPADLTSHDVVRCYRRATGLRRVGHTGTLDPFATGLLLLCVGAMTRLAEYFHLLSKTYRATLKLGEETTTDDRMGASGPRSDRWEALTLEQVATALANRVGEGLQQPPAFSAKRVNGTRAYERARAGEMLDLDFVPVRVHALTLERFTPPEVEFESRVSTGTYIRALARDVGRDLGCGAHLTELRRTRIGPFRVEEAATLESIERGTPPTSAVKTPYEALGWLPVRELTAEEELAVRHGGRIRTRSVAPCKLGEPSEDELPVILVRGARLLAVAERLDGELQPRKVLGGG
jgi:tRNA pseudouridine55 synthase